MGRTRRMVVAAAAVAVLMLAVGTALSKGKPAPSMKTTDVSMSAAVSADTSVEATVDVTARETRLDPGEVVTWVTAAEASATFACRNGGGNNPQATQFFTVSGPVSATATATSDATGQLTQDVQMSTTIGPGDLTCPNGQSVKAYSAKFSNITVTDVANAVSATASDQEITFSG